MTAAIIVADDIVWETLITKKINHPDAVKAYTISA